MKGSKRITQNALTPKRVDARYLDEVKIWKDRQEITKRVEELLDFIKNSFDSLFIP